MAVYGGVHQAGIIKRFKVTAINRPRHIISPQKLQLKNQQKAIGNKIILWVFLNVGKEGTVFTSTGSLFQSTGGSH